MAGPPAERFALDYLDKLCLAGTSRDHGTSASPVWQLEVEGDFDEEVAARAVAALARRYPILVSHVAAAEVGGDWRRARRLVYEVDPRPDLERLFHAVDLSGASEETVEVFRRRLFDRYLFPDEDYPAQLTWARTGEDRGVLFLQQHHAIADGRAFFGLLGDLAELYERAAAGGALDDVEPIGRLPEELVAEPRRWPRLWGRLAGFVQSLVDLVHSALAPPDQLACNVRGGAAGHNDVVHLVLPGGVLDALRPMREREGLSANDLIAGALASALARWSAELEAAVRRMSFLIVADARPRGTEVRSFANHLSSFLVRLEPAAAGGALAMARAVGRQVRRQVRRRSQIRKLLAEAYVVRSMSVGAIHDLVYGMKRAPVSFSFSNLIPISPREGDGRIGTSRWTGASLRIMTPCPFLQAVNTTVIRYGGGLCFNFNYREGLVSRQSVERLVELFLSALGEAVPHLDLAMGDKALAA